MFLIHKLKLGILLFYKFLYSYTITKIKFLCLKSITAEAAFVYYHINLTALSVTFNFLAVLMNESVLSNS